MSNSWMGSSGRLMPIQMGFRWRLMSVWRLPVVFLVEKEGLKGLSVLDMMSGEAA